MSGGRLEGVLRACVRRHRARSFEETWVLVSDALQEIQPILRSRAVGDLPELTQLAEDPDLAVKDRRTVCWILGRSGVRSATDTLVRVAANEVAELRVAAIRALGELDGRHASEIVTELALTDPDSDVRYASVYSLQAFNSTRSADVLITVLKNQDELSSIRGQAAESLASVLVARRRTVSALRAALSDPSAEVRFWSAHALGFLGTLEVIEDLRRVVGDKTVVDGWGSVGEEAQLAIESIQQRGQRERTVD